MLAHTYTHTDTPNIKTSTCFYGFLSLWVSVCMYVCTCETAATEENMDTRRHSKYRHKYTYIRRLTLKLWLEQNEDTHTYTETIKTCTNACTH